jgi:RimJ/RimL family protein N-acetyltransferase
MQLRFDPVSSADAALLGRFLGESEWPYHFERSVDASWLRARLDSGYFFGGDARAFWFRGEDDDPLGLARVFELDDATPLVDLRIKAAARGQGVGTLALRGLTLWHFSEHAGAWRLGGYTRHDNLAMRRAFEKCGYRLEAQHRRGWRVAGAEPVDAVGYAILREEAERL